MILFNTWVSSYARPVKWLLLASGLCVGLLLGRIIKADSLRFIFLVWNLFLAWIPLGIALVLTYLQRTNQLKWQVAVVGLLTWLLFFPNCPYIITDLLHLRKPTPVPVWYDSLMVFSFALIGLQTGLLSLHLVQKLLAGWWGNRQAYLLTVGSLFLAGFGVYLGRFQRWNSWDILSDPIGLVQDCLIQLTNPAALQLAGSFALTLAFLYFIFVSFLHPDPRDPVA